MKVNKIFSVFAILLLLCTSTGCGSSKSAAASSENSKPAASVCITATGEKFHRLDCHTVKKLKKQMSREEAVQRGYEPCKICKP